MRGSKLTLGPNLRKRMSFAIRHPGYAVRVLARDFMGTDDRFLALLAGATRQEVRMLRAEPFTVPGFLEYLRTCEAELQSVRSIGADLHANKVLVQYAALRALRPDVVVETGVANGVSSTYLLLALQLNGNGVLHSIDIGDPGHLPRGKQTGWLVPSWLRGRWTLHLGDARALLPTVLQQLGTIDVFVHDSLHTHTHMMFEFVTAYPYLRSGGVLLVDDAQWNSAFEEFAKTVRPRQAGVVRGIGMLRK